MAGKRFLVLDDEPGIRRILVRLVRPHGEPVEAASARDADRLFSQQAGDGSWKGFIVDQRLPDGSGVDVLRRGRLKNPQTPALVLTGCPDADIANIAYDLRAGYLAKPVSRARIERFLREAASVLPRLERMIDSWVLRYQLSSATVDILRRLSLGQNRKTIAAERGTSVRTIDAQLADLFRRVGTNSEIEILARLLRDVAGG
jgi:DNA-binding NarL/FixJ family response regulator